MKNMPWWWREEGWSIELVACTRRTSSVVTSIGGGLYVNGSVKWSVRLREEKHLRPGAVDANDPARLEAIGVGVLDVGDVPPDLADRCESGRGGREEGEGGPLHGEGLTWSSTRRERDSEMLVGEDGPAPVR